ncbi:MAG: HD-GYP domain-containing protein [Hydrogenovibrio sp.]|nr:HD-GYP domain-containing protein [Hydrogenovibrio sp.]
MATHSPHFAHDMTSPLLLSEVIGALSYALDLTEGQPAGHSIRCCWIGMHLGEKLGLTEQEQWDLYYTLLLKDAGCSSNAARLYELYGNDDREIKREFKFVDNERLRQITQFVVKHTGAGENFLAKAKRLLNLSLNGEEFASELIETRCERGADIAVRLGFNERIANGIRYLDEHWNGNGRPYRLSGNDIPVTSQIALLAQVADVFFMTGHKSASLQEVTLRSGTWFNPELVSIFRSLQDDFDFWHKLGQENLQKEVQFLEPAALAMNVTEDRLDDITAAFGMIVDSKSQYTYNHSSRVTLYTDSIAEHLGFSDQHRRYLRRGALLHDIGKLGISNSILDKPGKLTEAEWKEVQNHALYTEEILSHLSPFATLAKMSGAHHERLDGQGYPYGLHADDISLDTRIITVADIFDAISAARPYRDAVPVERTLEIMTAECGSAIDETVLDALKVKLPELDLAT